MNHAPSYARQPSTLPGRKSDGGSLPLVAVQGMLIRGLDALLAWQARSHERRNLSALDERLLHDIGVDRASADAEASKPFWRA